MTMHCVTLPSHQGILDQKKSNMTVIPHQPYIVSRLKIKVRGRHFDTIEVIEAESQAVPNALTEQDLHDAFKKTAEALEMVHTRKRGRGLLQG
jgi:hypothetical protein